jgi:hypothetical protein
MDDPLEAILAQVASGELSPEDAEAIVGALATEQPVRGGQTSTSPPEPPTRSGAGPAAGRAVRVKVQEGGRTVVNLRIPMSWAGLSSLVPGLSNAQVQRVSDALRNGERGPIVDIQDANGDGVVISTE